MQTKPQCDFNFISTRLEKIEKSDNANNWQGGKEKGIFFL